MQKIRGEGEPGTELHCHPGHGLTSYSASFQCARHTLATQVLDTYSALESSSNLVTSGHSSVPGSPSSLSFHVQLFTCV